MILLNCGHVNKLTSYNYWTSLLFLDRVVTRQQFYHLLSGENYFNLENSECWTQWSSSPKKSINSSTQVSAVWLLLWTRSLQVWYFSHKGLMWPFSWHCSCNNKIEESNNSAAKGEFTYSENSLGVNKVFLFLSSHAREKFGEALEKVCHLCIRCF